MSGDRFGDRSNRSVGTTLGDRSQEIDHDQGGDRFWDRSGQVTPDVGTVGGVYRGTPHCPIPDELASYFGDPADIVEADDESVRAELRRRVSLLGPAWHVDAACRGEPTELFFPRRGQDGRKALEICDGCCTPALPKPSPIPTSTLAFAAA